MGLSVGEAYNDHRWAKGVEWGTEPRIVYGKGKPMKIPNRVPGYYKGRDINTVPFNVKYEKLKPPLEVYKVEHPGSRAFLVYTDAFKRLVGNMKGILRRAFKNKW